MSLAVRRSAPRGYAHTSPFVFTSVARSHPGAVRKLNEDAVLTRPDVGLWAVADGMGGHEAGDVASAAVVDALERVSDFSSAFAFRREVRTALGEVNAQLQHRAIERLSGLSGATVVTLLAHGGHYACIWAGDCRAYIRRHGRLDRISRDHSRVQELIDAGKLDPSLSLRHQQAHVVTRAVGARAQLELDGAYGRIENGDRFILCSDGVTTALSDAHILEQVREPCLSRAADKIVADALAEGAPDNISVILVDAVIGP